MNHSFVHLLCFCQKLLLAKTVTFLTIWPWHIRLICRRLVWVCIIVFNLAGRVEVTAKMIRPLDSLGWFLRCCDGELKRWVSIAETLFSAYFGISVPFRSTDSFPPLLPLSLFFAEADAFGLLSSPFETIFIRLEKEDSTFFFFAGEASTDASCIALFFRSGSWSQYENTRVDVSASRTTTNNKSKLSMTDQHTLFTLTEAFQASFTSLTRLLIADSLADPTHILCFSISRIALPIPDDSTMDLVTGKSLILESIWRSKSTLPINTKIRKC